MEHLLQALITWLHLHPTWAGMATGVITFIESLAIIGFFVPGSVMLTAAGGLIGSGLVPAADIFIWAIIGSILGDGLSFLIGYRYYRTIRNRWPFTRYPQLITRGEQFFHKHGGKGIFIGRFIGPIRPILPLIAGMLRMPPRRFLVVEILSGLIWAPLYMVPGIILGAASAHFAPEKVIQILLLILFIIFLVWLTIWFIRLFMQSTIMLWSSWCDQQWRRLVLKHHFIYQALYEHAHPRLSRPLSIAFFTLVFSILFLGLSFAISVQAQWIVSLDQSFFTFFESLHNPQAKDIIVIVYSFLGQWPVMLGSTILLTTYLVYKRDWHAMRTMLGLIVLAGLILLFLKSTFYLAPPNIVLAPPAISAFPSASVLLMLVVWGFVAFLVSHNNPAWVKKLAYWSTGNIIALTAFCDLYLNIQWVSSIIASLLLGGMLLGILIIGYRRHEGINTYNPIIFAIILIVCQLMLGSGYALKNTAALRQNYQLKQTRYYLDPNHWWTSPTLILPLYQFDRFNHPDQVLNIEWLGEVNKITEALTAAGWHKALNFSYPAIKRRLQGDNITVLSPLAAKLNGRPAVITMTKTFDQTHSLILVLWEADFYTTKTSYFIGNISYHTAPQNWLWHNQNHCPIYYPAPVYELQLNANWETQFKSFIPKYALKMLPCIQNANLILQVRSNSDD